MRARDHVFDPPLVPGRLVRRDNRFIATIAIDDGRRVQAHCTNTGSLMGVLGPGRRVHLRPEPPSPTRRTAFTWVLVRHHRHWVGIDTLLPNRLGYQVAARGSLPALAGYQDVRREVPYGERSRVDLLLTAPGRRDCYVEIKNCHLTARTLDEGVAGPRVPRHFRDIALFPDAVTARGLRHLRDLAGVVRQGHRGVLLVVIQRNDCDAFAAAAGIDPAYAAALAEVAQKGVEIHAWACQVSPHKVRLARPLPVLL
jgi:sugar fermentation stimulation protein A